MTRERIDVAIFTAHDLQKALRCVQDECKVFIQINGKLYLPDSLYQCSTDIVILEAVDVGIK